MDAESSGTLVTIIGCGPGGGSYLLPVARQAALNCTHLAGTQRLLALFPNFGGTFFATEEFGMDGALHELALAQGTRGVLVSGSPYLFSLGGLVQKKFGADRCRIIPGISSVQVACWRAGIESSGIPVFSAHAALPETQTVAILTHPSFALLCGNSSYHPYVCKLAAQAGQGRRICYCRDLTLPEEVFADVTPDTLPQLLQGGRELLLFLSHS